MRASAAAAEADREPQSRQRDDDVLRLGPVSVTANEANKLWLPAVAVYVLHANLDGKCEPGAEWYLSTCMIASAPERTANKIDASFCAEPGMLLVAYKVAEFIWSLGVFVMLLIMWFMYLFFETASGKAGQGRGRISWIWWWPTSLWASWKMMAAGFNLVCVPAHLGGFIVCKPP